MAALTRAEIDRRFDHHPPDEQKVKRHERLRSLAKGFVEDALSELDKFEAKIAASIKPIRPVFRGNWLTIK